MRPARSCTRRVRFLSVSRACFAVSAAIAGGLAPCAAAQLALQPGSTADFKLDGKLVGAAGNANAWAPTPAPAGQLPSELLQLGPGFPMLGAQTIVLSATGMADPPTQVQFQSGPTPTFGFGFDAVSINTLGIHWSGVVIDNPTNTSGSATPIASEVSSHGQCVLKNTGTTTLHLFAGAVLSSIGYAVRPGTVSAAAIGGQISMNGGSLYTPSLEAGLVSGGTTFFGSGGLGPSGTPNDIVYDFALHTSKTYLYYGVRARAFDLPAGGTLSFDGSVARYAEGGAAGALQSDGGGALSSIGGAGNEQFYTLPGGPTFPSGGALDATNGAALIWTNQSLTGLWNNTSNWSPTGLPGTVANILFENTGITNGAGLVRLNGNQFAGSLTFFNESGSYTIDPVAGINTLTLNNGAGDGQIANWADAVQQINCNVTCPDLLSVRTVIDTQTTRFNGAINAARLNLVGSGSVTFSGAVVVDSITTSDNGAMTFNGPATFRLITVDNGAMVNVVGPQTHPAGSMISVVNGAMILRSDAGAPGTFTTGVHEAGVSAQIIVQDTEHLGDVDLSDLSQFTQVFSVSTASGGAASSPLLRMHTLAVSTGAAVDLSNNQIVVDATPLATISGYVASGRNGGAWTGPGMRSSSAAAAAGTLHKTALGTATAGALGISNFLGEPVAPNAVIVRYTLAGDANLDRVVDTLDFNSLAANFGGSAKFWYQSDFNYDGVVDTLDFNSLASNFGLTLPPDAPTAGSSATLVPEPASIGFLAAAALLLSRRRRR